MVCIIFKYKLPKTEYVLSDFTSTITGKKNIGAAIARANQQRCGIKTSLYRAIFLIFPSPISVYSSFFCDVSSLPVRVLVIRSIGIDITSNFCHIPSVFQYIFYRQGDPQLCTNIPTKAAEAYFDRSLSSRQSLCGIDPKVKRPVQLNFFQIKFLLSCQSLDGKVMPISRVDAKVTFAIV